jgi:hypothetical protein
MPGLLRAMGRTAVVAGTATAVSNRVSRRQAARWSDQGSQYAPPGMPPQQQQYYDEPPQQAAPPPVADDPRIEQLQKLAELKGQGVLTEEEFAAEKARVLAG